MGPRMAVGGGLGVIVIAAVAALLGVNPAEILNMAGNQGGGPAVAPQPGTLTHEEKELSEFVSVVLADTEDTWSDLFRKMGKTYQFPHLVLFTESVQSACGLADAAIGPFYCGADTKVYIDLSFYDELKSKLDAPGDFAQAYVIAHEIGHHVQNLLGTLNRVHGMRQKVDETEFNKLSVRLELQADFFAGVWAHYAQKVRGILDPGDIEEALNAASAIGDDRLQRKGRGYVTPDSFTHGTSAQRVRWFRRGFETGDVRQGDTFVATEL
jgi:predicted metalloprotease